MLISVVLCFSIVNQVVVYLVCCKNNNSNESMCLNDVFMEENETRNVSIRHGCPLYCQICINRELSLTKVNNS